jgi:hypothetical protein
MDIASWVSDGDQHPPCAMATVSRANCAKVKVRCNAVGASVTTAARCSRVAVRMRSAFRMASRLMAVDRNREESTPRLRKALAAFVGIGSPTWALVPAEWTVHARAGLRNRRASLSRIRYSAIGDRHRLAVETTRTSNLLLANADAPFEASTFRASKCLHATATTALGVNRSIGHRVLDWAAPRGSQRWQLAGLGGAAGRDRGRYSMVGAILFVCRPIPLFVGLASELVMASEQGLPRCSGCGSALSGGPVPAACRGLAFRSPPWSLCGAHVRWDQETHTQRDEGRRQRRALALGLVGLGYVH